MTQVNSILIGRQRAQAALDQALAVTDHTAGGVLLLAGEAGVGKTSLLEACLDRSGLRVLKGTTSANTALPYGPIIAALRAYLRVYPRGLADCGPLAVYLTLLLPELRPSWDRRAEALGWHDEGHLRGLIPIQPAQAGFVAGAERFSAAEHQTDPALHDEGHLRGLIPIQPAQAGFVAGAEHFSAAEHPALLVEAICQAFAAIARAQPTVLILDDLQWADSATLELVPTLASVLAPERLLIVGTYRNDELGRAHPLRRLRNDLRRARLLREIAIEPLDRADTAMLVTRILGQSPGPLLAAALYACSGGVPLFVEELAAALAHDNHLCASADGVELEPGADLPIPDTLRDAVLLRLDDLPETSLHLLDFAVVAGRSFDLALVAALAGSSDGFDALFDCGIVVDIAPGRAAFRHALTRDVLYADIAWGRRRALHRQLAEHTHNAAPLTIAQHWLAAQEPERARAALRAASHQAAAIHAYRDAADAAQRALELWPEGVDYTERLALLDQLGQYTQLCGQLADAARAWREVADDYRQTGDMRAYALTERKLAHVAELHGQPERALAAHAAAAQAFAACGLLAEAATERLAAAAHLRSTGRYRAALDLLANVSDAATLAARPALHARLLGLEGNLRVCMGQVPDGLALVQRGLALALKHNLAGAAAEIYQRLADALEHTSRKSLSGSDAMTRGGDDATANAQLRVTCLTAVLYQTGEWDRAMTLCGEVLAASHDVAHARTVASGVRGLLYVLRGQLRHAQPLLRESAALAQQIGLTAMELLSAWGLALLDEDNGADDAAAERGRFILSRWEQAEDVHYVIPVLRWAVSFFASAKATTDARACANALARIANASGQPAALSALAHALGELALLEGDAPQAVQHFARALDLLRDVNVPYCHASTQWRAGIACAAAQQRDAAVAHLTSAYRTARTLGARPLATRITQTLAALGEPIGARIGPSSAAQIRSAGLTRRQREILQFVAQGQTNAEIACALVLSPRTVEMHVANMLATLDSRSRAEAVRRAADLGLLDEYSVAREKYRRSPQGRHGHTLYTFPRRDD